VIGTSDPRMLRQRVSVYAELAVVWKFGGSCHKIDIDLGRASRQAYWLSGLKSEGSAAGNIGTDRSGLAQSWQETQGPSKDS